MANISQEVWYENLEKLEDGTYKRKNQIAKAKNGTTLDEHLAESTQQAHLAKNIGLEDTEGNFTATELEGAMNELFTNVSSGKDLVGGAITDVDDSVVIPTDPTFQQLADAISEISTGIDLEPTSAGDGIFYEDATLRRSSSPSFEKVKEARVLLGGNIRVFFRLFGSGYPARAMVYINDEPIGIDRRVTTDNSAEFVEDFSVSSGDLIQIYARTDRSTYNPDHSAHVSNFKMGIKLPTLAEKIL